LINSSFWYCEFFHKRGRNRGDNSSSSSELAQFLAKHNFTEVWCQSNVLHKPQEKEAIWHRKQAALLEQVRDAELSALLQVRSKQDSADQRLSLIQADLEQAREKEVELAAALLKERERGAELAVKVMEEEQGRQDDHDRYSEALALLRTDHAHKQHAQHRCIAASAHLNAMYTRWIVLQFVYATWNSYTKLRRREILQSISTRLKNKNSIRTWSSVQRAACTLRHANHSSKRAVLFSQSTTALDAFAVQPSAVRSRSLFVLNDTVEGPRTTAAEESKSKWNRGDAEEAVVAEELRKETEESAHRSALASASAHEQQKQAEDEASQSLQRIAAENPETWEALQNLKDAEATIVMAKKQLQVSEESAKQSPLASAATLQQLQEEQEEQQASVAAAASHEQQELAEEEAVHTEYKAAKARQKKDEDDQKTTTVSQNAGVGAMMHFLANVFSPSNSPSLNSMSQNGREDPGGASPGKLAAGQGGAGGCGMYVCGHACPYVYMYARMRTHRAR
jgi:hypothetical protein